MTQQPLTDAGREAIAQIIARAYGGSLYPGLGVPGDYPVDAVDYRAADAILAALHPAQDGGNTEAAFRAGFKQGAVAPHYRASEDGAWVEYERSSTTSNPQKTAENAENTAISSPPPPTEAIRAEAVNAATAADLSLPLCEYLQQRSVMFSHRGDGFPTQFVHEDGHEAARLLASLYERGEGRG